MDEFSFVFLRIRLETGTLGEFTEVEVDKFDEVDGNGTETVKL